MLTSAQHSLWRPIKCQTRMLSFPPSDLCQQAMSQQPGDRDEEKHSVSLLTSGSSGRTWSQLLSTKLGSEQVVLERFSPISLPCYHDNRLNGGKKRKLIHPPPPKENTVRPISCLSCYWDHQGRGGTRYNQSRTEMFVVTQLAPLYVHVTQQ